MTEHGATIALVPARGGSKAIPRKNIALLAGKPLLAYTSDAVRASRTVDRAVLSTDDEEIADVGRSLGLEVPFLRPAEIAGDNTPMLAVLQHFLAWFEQGNAGVRAIVLLQPTSPLRTGRHIDEAVTLFRSRDADSVVSVVEVPHQFTPSSLMRMSEDRVAPFLETGPSPLQRQTKERLWARNGPAVLVLSSSTIRAGRLYTERSYGYPMDRESSVDIDGPEDLQLAELFLKARQNR